jgi:hypothetical protein
MASWIQSQKKNFSNHTEIMKIPQIYNTWKTFTESDEFSVYFLNNKQIWYKKLKDVKLYLNKHGELPSKYNILENSKTLAAWVHNNKMRYPRKDRIMKDHEIYNTWRDFISTEPYSKYFNLETQQENNIVDNDEPTSDLEDEDSD